MTIEVRGSEQIDWMYPNIYDQADTLTISLMHVRATMDICIKYDSARDGWSIGRIGDDDDVFVEKAFIPAWEGE